LSEQDGGVLTSFSTVNIPIDDFSMGGFAISVSDNFGDLVACGEVPPFSGSDAFIALPAQNASGLGGVAWLHERDDRTQVSIFLTEVGEGSDESSLPPDEEESPPPPEEPTPTATAEPTESPRPVRTPSPTAEPEESDGYVTYTSPSYGWSLRYDPLVWEVRRDEVEDSEYGPIDWFNISNGISFISIATQGGWTEDTPANSMACVQWYDENISLWEGYTNVEPWIGDDGKPVRGGNRLDAYGAWSYTFIDEETGASLDNVLYVRCISIDGGRAQIELRQWTTPRGYNSQAAAREDLLSGLELP